MSKYIEVDMTRYKNKQQVIQLRQIHSLSIIDVIYQAYYQINN